MKHSLLSLSLVCILFMINTACNSKADSQTTEATVRWTGPLAADGCGYFLIVDGKELKPSNEEVIPESFQQQYETKVNVSYETLEEPKEYSCGMLPTRYSSTIKINEITKL